MARRWRLGHDELQQPLHRLRALTAATAGLTVLTTNLCAGCSTTCRLTRQSASCCSAGVVAPLAVAWIRTWMLLPWLRLLLLLLPVLLWRWVWVARLLHRLLRWRRLV